MKLLSAMGVTAQLKARWLIGATLAVSVAVGPAIFAAGFATAAPAARNADIPVVELMKPGELPDKFLGNADAPITIVEYSSMTCPHCATFHDEVFPELKKKYIDTGKARYVLRDFPLDNIAAAAFMLARCVDDSRHYDMIKILYAHQNDWAFNKSPIEDLKRFSKQAGFTDEMFNKCLSDTKLLKSMENDREHANKEFAIHSTPTFFVNGKRLKGGHTLKEFEELISQVETAK
ncbi:MAG: DsbA family protein [Alphaproteobacteria bacterium]